jgi:hypothetical protein
MRKTTHRAHPSGVTDCPLLRRAIFCHTAEIAALNAERPAVVNPSGERRVAIVDLLTPGLIAVSWQTPTQGRYGYQTWRKTVALHDGICALTGKNIKQGDAVFRPKSGTGRRPVNWDEMILVAAVDENVVPDSIR